MNGVVPKPPATPLSEQRRQLLGQYLRRGTNAPGSAHAVVPKPTPDQPQPVSFAQASLWLLDRLEGTTTQYHVPDAMRLRGELNREALIRALNALVERHEGLRARFVEVAGEPMQLTTPGGNIELPIEDVRSLAEATREAKLATLLEAAVAQPFDLSQGPLVRARLYQLGPRDHVLLTVVHHIVCDGWSIGVFNRELLALYSAFARGAATPFAPLPMQYADYVRRQRQQLQPAELNRLLSYWVKQLSGAPPLVTLPTDKPRPTRSGRNAQSHAIALPRDLSNSLRSFSQREGVTLFMTMLAAFKVLLARHSGQEDIIIGTPVAGRDQAAMEGLVGYFINALALRTDLSGNPTFRELLQRVKSTALDAYSHQELPFEKLVEKLQPQRERSHAPVFQILFNLFNLAPLPESFGGLQVERVPVHEPGAKFDLTLYASDTSEKLLFRAVYNADLFTEASIEGLLARYQTLLESIVADPSQPIGRLPMLTAADRRRYSVEDNSARPSNPFTVFAAEDTDQSIAARFEKMVRLAPTRVAVKTRKYEWTYAELNQRANRIAQELLRLNPVPASATKQDGGASPGGQVALLLEHDAPMIAAIFGVLKAGQTYVPLDSSHPKDRQAYILSDAQAQVILTDAKNATRASELSQAGATPIVLDRLDYQSDRGEKLPVVAPDATAYLLYTSGSTGTPKGVTQIHRHVLRHIANYTNSLHLGPEDRMVLFASYGFDAAVMGIFGALLNGATLYPYNVSGEDLDQMADWLNANGITIYHSTPTLYRYLVATLSGQPKFPKLRLIVMGGEKVVPQDVEWFQKWFGKDCQFINGYGPTECTIGLQCFSDSRTPLGAAAVPIGYPMRDLEVSLINPAGDPGQAFGEMVIRSPSLALGYWRQPELTAAAFQGAGNSTADRSYRTGDLGRLLPNGILESMGRRDFQVKIRGFRIELGEVEAVLRASPGVDDCVVIAVSDAAGEQRLLGYVVPARGQTGDADTLRRALLAKLPDYMIPSRFVFLEALPLTPNGKTNRNALPAPPPLGTVTGKDAYLAPRSDLEQRLTDIWQTALKVPRAGVRDDFFALGGHSLLGVRVLSLIEKQLGRKLPLSAIFDARTIEQLAALLQRESEKTPWRSLVPIQPNGSRPPLFGIHFLRYHALVPYLGADQPLHGLRYGLAAQTDDTEVSLPDTLEELAAHYIAEMRRFQPHGPYALVGYSFGGVVAYEMARQLKEQGQEIRVLALLDARLVIEPKLLPLSQVTRNVLKGGVKGVVRRVLARAKEGVNEQLPPGYKPHEHLGVHDARLRRSYAPKSYSGGLTLFKAGKTNDFYRTYGPPEDSWRKFVTGPIEVHSVPGSHLGILEEPHVRLLAEKLNPILQPSGK